MRPGIHDLMMARLPSALPSPICLAPFRSSRLSIAKHLPWVCISRKYFIDAAIHYRLFPSIDPLTASPSRRRNREELVDECLL